MIQEAKTSAKLVSGPADSCVMVIFGASGDLAKRKLIPALYNLSRDKLLSPNNFEQVLAEGLYADWEMLGQLDSPFLSQFRRLRAQAAPVQPCGRALIHPIHWGRQ